MSLFLGGVCSRVRKLSTRSPHSDNVAIESISTAIDTLLHCKNSENSLKVVIIKVTIYCSKGYRLNSGKKINAVSRFQEMAKWDTSNSSFPLESCSHWNHVMLFLTTMMSENKCEVLPAREAHPSFGVQRFCCGFSHWHG